MHWITILLHWAGVEPRTPSTTYNFWSGIGSDIGEATLIGAIVAMARHKACHVRGCWRLGKHPVADGLYKVCAKHHPDVADVVTVDTVARAHHAHRARAALGVEGLTED